MTVTVTFITPCYVTVTVVTVMCDITLILFYQVQSKKRDERIEIVNKRDLNKRREMKKKQVYCL